MGSDGPLPKPVWTRTNRLHWDELVEMGKLLTSRITDRFSRSGFEWNSRFRQTDSLCIYSVSSGDFFVKYDKSIINNEAG